MKPVFGVLAAIFLLFVLQDAFEVMLLPRRIRRHWRLTRAFFIASWAAWTRLCRPVRNPARREHMLALFGPLSMLLLFALWATALIACFGALMWAVQPGAAQGGGSLLSEQVYMSGVTFFTLGYGDVVPHSGAARLLAVLEAGTGIGFIAVVIGYLPVLYQLFTRREAHVIQLDGRAGSPPSAVTMLCRHAEGGGLDQLNELLREWEVWGSELLESHLSYPVLAYYRSQHDNQSWLGALGCIMDACALVLVGVPAIPPLQARMTFTMARQLLVEMATSFRIEPSRFDGGNRLSPEQFGQMECAFEDAGLEWDGGEDGEQTLAMLRATYEPLLDGLARHLLILVPEWMPSQGKADHWASGHRGLLARRLLEELSDRDHRGIAGGQAEPDGSMPLWRRMRARLRQRGGVNTERPQHEIHVNASDDTAPHKWGGNLHAMEDDLASDPPKKTDPAPDSAEPTAPKVPVDQQAQEEAGKVREESGGYD